MNSIIHIPKAYSAEHTYLATHSFRLPEKNNRFIEILILYIRFIHKFVQDIKIY